MTASTYRLIKADQRAVVPWKNGGGTTTELAQAPVKASGQDWSWRISIANVEQSGPFSMFAGIDRISCVVDGDGMDLRYEDGSVVALEPNQPVTYDGGATVIGKLRSTPIRNFNVMVDRRFFRSAMRIVRGPDTETVQTTHHETVFIHMLQGQCSVTPAERPSETLSAHESLLIEGYGEVRVQLMPKARAALVHLEALSGIN